MKSMVKTLALVVVVVFVAFFSGCQASREYPKVEIASQKWEGNHTYLKLDGKYSWDIDYYGDDFPAQIMKIVQREEDANKEHLKLKHWRLHLGGHRRCYGIWIDFEEK